MSHFVGGGIFQIGLNRTDLGCWQLTLRAFSGLTSPYISHISSLQGRVYGLLTP